jgi:hypothetical protein
VVTTGDAGMTDRAVFEAADVRSQRQDDALAEQATAPARRADQP